MKAVVLSSGGVDSTTCLGLAIEKHGKENVVAVTIMYGQKHSIEIKHAEAIAEHYGVNLHYLYLTDIFRYNHSCTLLEGSEKEIAHSTYKEQLKETNGMPVATYVPFRNGLMLSAVTAYAMGLFPNEEIEIYCGIHADDAAGNAYPDCSKDFHTFMSTAIHVGSGKLVKMVSPFVGKHKADIIKEGLRLGVPYELTWSCYEGVTEPCGVCATCIDRRKAFEANGVKDPALKEVK